MDEALQARWLTIGAYWVSWASQWLVIWEKRKIKTLPS
jgi:hypothetical protein